MWSEKTIKKHRNHLIDRLEKWDEQTVDIYNNPDAMSYSVKHVEVYSDVCLPTIALILINGQWKNSRKG